MTLKPAIVANYNRQMGYVDKGDRNGKQLLYQSPYIEMDKETGFPSPRPDNFEQPHSPEVLWFQPFTQRLPTDTGEKYGKS
jgi:hypothetical protein